MARLTGVCFGHQIIARALGKQCVQNVEWEVGPTKLELTEEGKRVFGVETMVSRTPHIVFASHESKISQNTLSTHHDHVPEVPTSCHLLASSSICHNQGFIRFAPGSPSALADTLLSHDDIQIFTMQGHPEFTPRIVDTIVRIHAASGVFGPKLVESVRAKADWRDEGITVAAKAIWRILGVDGPA